MIRRPAGAGNPRWLLSFADLLMLLLAFFVVLGAARTDPLRVGAGVRAAFGGPASVPGAAPARGAVLDPDRLFEPGEAVLRPGGGARLAALGRSLGTGRVTIASAGDGGGVPGRLDRFELAAARTAAIARALALAPARIAIEMHGAAPGTPQRITVAAAR